MKNHERSALTTRIEANVTTEIPLTAAQTTADPFNDVTLDAVFIDPRGRELRVPAFWAGGQTWKVRYASPLLGRHRFRTECTPPDAGLHGVTGTVEVVPYKGENPLYLHGPLRKSANSRYLEHTDGTPFFWLADTWWMGLCHRIHFPDEFQRLAGDRKEKGFNVIQIVAGLYPDMLAFDQRGANEAGFPWEENYARIRPEYFDAADARLRALVEQGFSPCLVGAWGYFIPWMGVEKLKQHWRYLIARYAAMPMVWCIAGEANLPWYQAKGFPWDDREQVRDWTKVMRFVHDTDPFHRLVTIHPTAIRLFTARNATDDLGLLDIDFLQTGHAGNEAIHPTIETVRTCYADNPTLPVINSEPCYEMLNDNLTTEWPRRAFWSCVLNGAAGHTYGANGIWQCNRLDLPHGPSPTGHSYGRIAWEEAMNLGGSRQCGLGKKLLEQYAWQNFRPHPEWASFSSLKWLSLGDAGWIWSDHTKPAPDAPNIQRYFRRTFTIPAGREIARARLRFVGSSHVEAQLNGRPVGLGWDHLKGSQFDDRAGWLRPGENALSIWIEHRPPVGQPIGLIACLEITFTQGEALRIETSEAWKCSEVEVPGWQGVDFDDSAWKQAMVIGRPGDQPWGTISEPDETYFGPQAAGIPGVVRIIYAPVASPVVVKHLGADTAYQAAYFDPVNGARSAIGTVKADAAGEWTCAPLPGIDHDWVIILGPKNP